MHLTADTNLRWRVLQTIHPLFFLAESLPTVKDVDLGAFGNLREDDGERLKNEITTLRADLNLNIIRQKHLDIGELDRESPDFVALESSLEAMWEEFEALVDTKIQEEVQHTFEPASVARFPRLLALSELLQQYEIPSTGGNDLDDVSDTNVTDLRTESSWSKKYPPSSTVRVANYIQFPRDQERLETCRRTITDFKIAMESSVGDPAGSWVSETQTQDYTKKELEDIRHAHEFASTCTSLFTHMAKGTKCGTPHRAKLHLSGFKNAQLKMNIGTCQEADWISATFTRSLYEHTKKTFFLDHICSPIAAEVEHSKVLHISFDSEGMWISNEVLEPDDSRVSGGEKSLEYHLTNKTNLTLKHRKLAGVLLAASMFQLSDSPWFEQHLAPECIFVPAPNNRRLEQWCPRIHCTLVPRQDTRVQSDNIAALGVLVMELETDRKAEWAEDDEDFDTGEKSNRVRLARMLGDWKDDISDDYRRVAEACLKFDSLVESLDHSDIEQDWKGLAIIYKCILEPLFRHITSSFGGLGHLFQGMFGPGRSLTSPIKISSNGTAKRVLFDDDDSPASLDDKRSAKRFIDDLKPFLESITALRQTIKPWEATPEKVRIVVLDSGVDDSQPMIRSAIRSGRIQGRKSKSFVGRSESWMQDSHGHGTHVTQLLLKMAPAAEIHVGKICTDKVINAEYMPGIAEAINWAVKECDAHIISISFGFQEEDDLIDAALESAIDAGKLIIAAASNNGGLSGRARPARREGVMCIHATDGKGNKGKMNPSPVPNADNFATLGVAITSRWKGNDVWISGTSFAVPIAVGFAANVLEFAKICCTNIKPQKAKALYRKRGMEAIFRRMAVSRDDYDFVHPGRMWDDWGNKPPSHRAITIIEDTLNSL